jgi:hypothetical protein
MMLFHIHEISLTIGGPAMALSLGMKSLFSVIDAPQNNYYMWLLPASFLVFLLLGGLQLMLKQNLFYTVD